MRSHVQLHYPVDAGLKEDSVVRQISQNYRTGELTIVEVAPPRAPQGGILVRTSVSLISSGTERTIINLAKKNLFEKARERPDLVRKVIEKAKREGPLAALDAVRAKLDNPIPLGYSLAGVVEEVGLEAHGFARGDRVACAGAGYANHAESNAVPQNLAVPVPDEVSDEEASFVTVAAIALHGTRLVRPGLGHVVAVIGLGLVGQLAVSLLMAQGCDVVGIDTDRSKVNRALSRGALAGGTPGDDDCVELVRAVSRGYGADAVVITASSPTNEPLVLAGDLARDRATVSIVGLLPLDIPRKTFYEKELTVVVSRSYGPGRYDTQYEERGHDYPIGYVRWTERRNLEAVLGAIVRKRLDVASLISHRFPFEHAMDAYALISGERPEPHLGVLLSYPPSLGGDNVGVEKGAAAETRPQERPLTLGVALVGTGSFATSVLLPNLAKVQGARLVATASRRGLSARQAAERYGTRVAASLDEVLTDADVNAVVIATRHDMHASQAAKALIAGRDVFLEKPAAVDEEQLRMLKKAVADSGRRILVGFNRRFAPFARAVKDAFKARHTGLVMHARINAGQIAAGSWVLDPREGGGRVIGEVCHFVDLFSYWSGAHPLRVSAHGIGTGAAHAPDDNLVMGLSFSDGSVGSILYSSMGDSSIGKESYEVFCDGKIARIDDWRTLTVTSKGRTRKTRSFRPDKGHSAELEEFVHACRGGEASPISWDSIEATTRATFAIDRARIEGALIEL
jgi:predicted dehydrogenase/threonine dehydrogenase-like Zn-dependent dehydrogenase